jgi:hypothetical protein
VQVWQFESEQATQETFPLGISKKKFELQVVQMGPSAHVWQLGKLLQSTQVAGVAESKT